MTNKGNFFRTAGISAVLLLNIGCDQISKNIIREQLAYHEEIILIDKHFTLIKVENTGAFLSLGDGLPAPFKVVLLSALPLLALLFGLFFLYSRKDIPLLNLLGISFAIGGGIGNIYDRIVYGSVTDFLHLDFVLFQTGIFNMADVSIMVGMALLLLQAFFERNKTTSIAQ